MIPRLLPKYLLLATLVLPAQGGFSATEAPVAAPAAASAPPPAPESWTGWAKTNPLENSTLAAGFEKYLNREENTVKNAMGGAVAAMPTRDVKGAFSVINPQKVKAKRAALAALKAQYPEEFWAWLRQRKDIRQPLFLTTHPTPPQYVANLAYLWKAVGPQKADKYAQLLLAASLRTTPVNAGGVPAPVTPSPIESRLAQLIGYGSKEVPEPLVFFLHHKDKFAQGGNLKSAEVNAVNPERLALVTGTYPQRVSPSVADTVLRLISHLETKLPDYHDGRQWPLFHAEKAPYYLLNPLTQGVSIREQEFIWDRFAHPQFSASGTPISPRMVGYTKYGWEYESPEVKYKKSDWHPASWPRILEDGGVCGRQAQLDAVCKNTLGIPCATAGQPIHCANMFITRDGAGKYRADIGQSVTGGWPNTWPHVPIGATPAIAGFEGTAASWLAMAETANRISETNYHYSLFCYHAVEEVPGLPDKIHLLKTAVNLNPYHLGAWRKLMNLSAQMGTKSFNSVMLAMGDRLAYPDGPPPKPVEPKEEKKDGNLVPQPEAEGQVALVNPVVPPIPAVVRNPTGDLMMRVCVAQLVPGNYDRMLGSSVKSPEHLLAGVHDMWSLMDQLHKAGQFAGDGLDPVFQKYAAMVNPQQAGQLFRANFEKAVIGSSDVYGEAGSPLLMVVNSFRDVGAKMSPGERVAALKTMCEKLAKAAPKYQMGNKATLIYGQTFYLSCVKPNKAYASALNQLVLALRVSGKSELANGTLASYQAEAAHLAQQGVAEDRKRLKKDVLEALEKLRAEDRKRL